MHWRMQGGMADVRAILPPAKPETFRAWLSNNWKILRMTRLSKGFAHGHYSPAYLQTLTLVMAAVNRSKQMAALVAAVRGSLEAEFPDYA